MLMQKKNNIAIGAGSIATDKASTTAAAFTNQEASKSYVSVGDGTKGSDTQYRRITNVADGAADSDVATIGQLKKMSEKAGVYNEGWGIKIGDYTKKDANGTETTVKNAISVDRNLGTNLDTTGHVHLDVSKTGLVLGTVVDGAPGTDVDLHYGATGDYAVTVGGGANTASGKASVVIGGSGNTASDEAAVSSGGSSNVASGSMAAVYGGFDNEASGTYASIFAGAQNKASNMWTTVGGGALNEASGIYASVWGGSGNKATDNSAAVYGGLGNSAYGPYSAILGGGSNKAGGAAVVSGGASNEAAGVESAVLGGVGNIVTGANATAVGGAKGSVNGVGSVGILGGSTGINAPFTLAAGYQSTVTDTGVTSTPITEEEAEKFQAEGTHPGLLVGSNDPNNLSFKILDHFATAVGYQATADEAQTVAFGHDKGDTYYGTTTYKWKQKATVKDGHYYDEYGSEINEDSYKSLMNADGTWNDYSQPIATVEEKKYDSAYYNRLVKAADGIEDHDAVVMEQLKNASDVGSKIKVYQTDENGNIKFDKNNNPIEDTSDSDAVKTKREAAQKASEDAWGEAIGTGHVADPKASNARDNGSGQLVTGGTVYDALQKQKTDLTDALSVNAGWGIDVDKTKNNTISVKHNLSSGDSAYADTDATGLILGGSIKERKADKKYGAATASSVIVGAQNALASNDNSVVVGGLDNVASGANSTVVGGDNNKASGNQSAVFGGRDNTASGITSTASGGIMNVANGQNSTAVGGTFNYALGTGATSVGGYGKDYTTGYNSSVNGSYSVGIAGGSTGDKADYSLAAGRQAVVTTENGTAIGYQATTDEANTIAFGHDAGDVSGYTIEWEQLPNGQTNADGTTNDYTKAPKSVTATTYDSAAYNRLVKVANGVEDHDVVVMEQLKNASDVGSNIKVYKTDENGNVQFDENNKPIEDRSDAAKTKQKDSKDAWGKALGAGTFTTGTDTTPTNASTSDQLVTGKTLYNYDKPTSSQNYVNVNSTTGQNLSALDAQVKANADTLNDSTHNIKYYSVNSTNAPTFGLDAYTNEKNDGASPSGRASLAAGFITHTDGLASTVAGSYSGIYNKGTVSGTDFRGAAALSLGTVNINRNTDTTKAYSGVANSLIGQANVTTNSNAAIILGAGNTVKDSYRTISNLKLSGDMTAALKEAVPGSGGQVMVMGGGNSVDKAYMTQVTGVGNTVTGSGTEYGDDSTQLNYIEGFYTKLENGKNDYLIGAHNTVTGDSTDKNQSNIVFGDNHTLTNTKNNIILGSAGNGDTTTVSDVVSIGHNAKVSVADGVAIGSGSEATTAAGVAGYDPTGATADTTAAWTSKKAAVSVGTADETRQITGVAAGKEETDAVNVAQLKKLNGMKANVDATNIGKNLKGADGNTASAEDITANEKAWGAALGTGDIATPKDMLVTDKAIHDELRPTTDGTYVKGSQTTADNLSKLDAQVKTNADGISTNTTNITKNAGDITNLKNLSNITNEGEKVIKKLSKDAVKVEAGDRVTVTSTDNKETGTITYKVSANNNGTVTAGDQNLVSGDTVNTAINNAITNAGTATDTKLAGKANVDATNIGKNLKGADGKTASTEEITANENDWGTAIGTGEIAKDNGQLVTGKTVYDALHGGLDDVVFGHDGKDGKDGSIGLVGQTGKKGEDGKNAFATTIIKTEKGVDGVDGKNGKDGITRIVYNDTNDPANKHTVATLDDGMKYAGDTGTVANVKLNHQLKLSGTTFNDKDKKYDANSWTSDNIAVVSSAADETTGDATMYLKLNKDLNLTDKGSVRFGDKDSNTTLDASGLTIKSTVTKEGKTEVVNGPSMTKDGINGGGKAITNIGSGIEKDDKGNYTDKSKSSAANIGDVQTIVNDAKKELTNGTNGLNSKANVDASNIGENMKDANGNKASDTEINKNKESWASAIGTNTVAKDNKQLVTSDAVATALEKKADKTYVDQELNKKADKTYVDEQLDTKANKSDVYTKDQTYSKSEVDNKVSDITTGLDGKAGKDLKNIDETGEKVIKDLAKSSIKVIGDKNTTVTEGMDGDAKTYTVKVEGNGAVESGNTGLISGDTLYKEVRADINDANSSYIKSGNTVGKNLSALDTGLKTTSDLIHTNATGDTIQIGGNSTATKIDVSGKDAKGNTTGRVITGVISDASDPNSAANVGYVNGVTAANTQQIYRDMNNAYGRLDRNINRAAAGSNALAALHPLDYDPADKASFAVGYGHYRNANAAAIGAFYYPNANTMVNVGVSVGNGDPGINAGVSFKLGQGSAYNGVSKAEMAQTIHDQAEEIKTIKANDATKDKRIDALEKENQEMKKQIQEILARLNG